MRLSRFFFMAFSGPADAEKGPGRERQGKQGKKVQLALLFLRSIIL